VLQKQIDGVKRDGWVLHLEDLGQKRLNAGAKLESWVLQSENLLAKNCKI